MQELDIIKAEIASLKEYVNSIESLLKTVMSTQDVMEYLNTKREAVQCRLKNLTTEKQLILDSRLSDETKSVLVSAVQKRIEDARSELNRIEELIMEVSE